MGPSTEYPLSASQESNNHLFLVFFVLVDEEKCKLYVMWFAEGKGGVQACFLWISCYAHPCRIPVIGRSQEILRRSPRAHPFGSKTIETVDPGKLGLLRSGMREEGKGWCLGANQRRNLAFGRKLSQGPDSSPEGLT